MALGIWIRVYDFLEKEMTLEESTKELGRLHAETLDEWETRIVKACEERWFGTRPGPSDKVDFPGRGKERPGGALRG